MSASKLTLSERRVLGVLGLEKKSGPIARTAEAVARLTGLPVDEVRRALQRLETLEPRPVRRETDSASKAEFWTAVPEAVVELDAPGWVWLYRLLGFDQKWRVSRILMSAAFPRLPYSRRFRGRGLVAYVAFTAGARFAWRQWALPWLMGWERRALEDRAQLTRRLGHEPTRANLIAQIRAKRSS